MAIAARPMSRSLSAGQLSTEPVPCLCDNGPSVSGSCVRESFSGQKLAAQLHVPKSRKSEAGVQMGLHPVSTVRSLVSQWLHKKATTSVDISFPQYSMLTVDRQSPTVADLPPSLRNGVVVKERPRMVPPKKEERVVDNWGGFDLEADMFKGGRLVDNGYVFRERFAIRCYEVDGNRTASIETIANLLQEVSANHAQAVGFSNDGFATSPLMRERGMIWVTTRMHIEMFKYPKWGDFVEFDTWFQDPGRVGGRRDWNIRDAATGELIGCGTSKWVMMDEETRKLAPKDGEVKAELLVYCPNPSRFAPVDRVAANMKICKLDTPDHAKRNLQARRSDLDMNHHVNNVAYFGWMLESVPESVIMSHELASITLEYRRECISDDIVESLTSAEPANSTQSQQALPPGHVAFNHMLRQQDDLTEISRGRTVWRKKKGGVQNGD